MSTLFSLSSLVVMPFWFLMIFLPKWRYTSRILSSVWVAAGAALIYVILVIPQIPTVLPAVLNPNLEGIMSLLSTASGTTIAWVHFLAFDLFVGRWIYLDARARDLHPLITSPILFFTLMLGPLGFLAYLISKLFQKQTNQTLTNTAEKPFKGENP